MSTAHIPGCSAWHHQGGDADRDCPACMALMAAEQDEREGRCADRALGPCRAAADGLCVAGSARVGCSR